MLRCMWNSSQLFQVMHVPHEPLLAVTTSMSKGTSDYRVADEDHFAEIASQA